jgi:hypothetical protein
MRTCCHPQLPAKTCRHKIKEAQWPASSREKGPFRHTTNHPPYHCPRRPNIPHPPNTSLSPQSTHSSPPHFCSPSLRLCSPSSPHRISKLPSSIPRAPVPASHPPSATSPARKALELSPHAESKNCWRCVASPDKRRYEVSDIGVMRARVPDCEVTRI